MQLQAKGIKGFLTAFEETKQLSNAVEETKDLQIQPRN